MKAHAGNENDTGDKVTTQEKKPQTKPFVCRVPGLNPDRRTIHDALTLQQQQQLQLQQLAQAQAQAQAQAAGRGLAGGNEALLAMLRNAAISEQPQAPNLGRPQAFPNEVRWSCLTRRS